MKLILSILFSLTCFAAADSSKLVLLGSPDDAPHYLAESGEEALAIDANGDAVWYTEVSGELVARQNGGRSTIRVGAHGWEIPWPDPSSFSTGVPERKKMREKGDHPYIIARYGSSAGGYRHAIQASDDYPEGYPKYFNRDEVDVVILSGQSNAAGLAFWDNRPNPTHAAFTEGGYLTNQQTPQVLTSIPPFYELAPWGFEGILRYGTEVPIIQHFIDSTGKAVVVIKQVNSGMPITNWADGAAGETALLANITAGLDGIIAAGKTINLRGFVWMQGEANRTSPSATYETAMQDLLDRVDAHLQAGWASSISTYKKILVEPAPYDPNDRANTDNVSIAMQAVVAADASGDTIYLDTSYLSPDQIAGKVDIIHWDNESINALGILIAQSLLN